MTDYFDLSLSREEQVAISALGLAHLGDCVYELMVRTWLILHGYAKKSNLHRETVQRVRAPYQAVAMKKLEPLLTSEERAVAHRGRNAQVGSIPQHATRGEYALATALEALFGHLYLNGQKERLNALFSVIMEEEEHAV